MKEEEKTKQAIVEDIVTKGDKGEVLSEDEQLIYNTNKKVVKEESSWLVRNSWWLVVGITFFLVKMCSDLSKQ